MENALQFRAAFAIYSTKVIFLRLECDRLPWVAAPGASAALPLHSIIETHFPPLFNGKRVPISEMGTTIASAAKELATHLENEFTIFCKINLSFELEEQNSQAIAELAERLGIEDWDETMRQLKTLSPLASVCFRDVDEISKTKANNLDDANFTISYSPLDVLPGGEIVFRLKSKEPVICRQIRLLCGDEEVLRDKTPIRFDAGSRRTIRLPGIPVKHYDKLIKASSQSLSVHLILQGRDDPFDLSEELPYREVLLAQGPASVFLDVGSALSKCMVVELPLDPANTSIKPSQLTSELRRRITDACGGADEGVFLEGPHPSAAFVEEYGLSQTPKEKLDRYDDDQLAAHFARSISGLAGQLYRSESRLVSHVYWAFPNTSNRDFSVITQRVNTMLGGAILGHAWVVPESECLREAFSGSLYALAQAARTVVEEKSSAEEVNQKAEQADARIHAAWKALQAFDLARLCKVGLKLADLINRGAQRPEIPTLEDWHRELSKLECDENLSDFLVFDAGGYSLDVFAVFADTVRKPISLSFPAGSMAINPALVEELRKNAPHRPIEEHQRNAEIEKKDVCSDPEHYQQHALYSICRNMTEHTYRGPIDIVLDQVHQKVQGRGFPIILTGGGGQNQFLQQLLKRKLEERNLATVPINSPLLYGTLRTMKNASFEQTLFLCMASAFHPEDESPRYAPFTDILGGLVQMAMKK